MSEQEVLGVAAERATALATQDWVTLDALLHPGFVYTNSQGTRLTHDEYVDFVRTGPLRWRGQRVEDARVSIAGTVAVLTGVVVDDVLVDGEPHLLRFATTQTYVLVDGAWSYLAGHTAPTADNVS
jgi:hypothetical protein